MGFFDGGFGGLVSGALGALGGLAGGGLDAAHDRDLARMNQSHQLKVYQNQIQWKAADAKKAGLHPLAALGGGSYSPSNIASSGGTNYAGSLGKLGESIGDAFTAYMNKDEIAKKAAIEDQRAADLHHAQMAESAARTLMYNGQALEATRRAASYTVPMASGNEIMPGQVDSPSKYMDTINKFAWPRNPDGSRSDPIPSEDYRSIYEDVPVLEYLPFIDAGYHKWRSILTRNPIDGYRHNWRNNTWSR